MKILSSPAAVARWRSALPRAKSVGFVPTMGALHHGHLSLVKRARRENDVVVASIFVNPIQFGPNEDFSRYPRPFAADRKLLRDAGVAMLFAPTAPDMYAKGFSTKVAVSGITDTLCGAPTSRGPGHFDGVATVVTKLHNIVRPTRAYYGMKDFQQLRVIERMTEDLNMGIKIVRCPTVREKDGLAASSRNAYLSPDERSLAPRLYVSLQQGAKLLASSRSMNADEVIRAVEKTLAETPEIRREYVELVDPDTLQKLSAARRPALLAAAVRIGKTRLIDNILVR